MESDPNMQPCWIAAADTLVRELNGMEVSWPLLNTGEVRAEISTVLYALTNVGSKFSLLGRFLGYLLSDITLKSV